jgi:hypothetical protein
MINFKIGSKCGSFEKNNSGIGMYTPEEKKNCMIFNEHDLIGNNSYFSRYFIKKLKRFIMNIVYKLWTSLEESLLEKYFVEFKFYTNEKKFKCYLPLIVAARNYDEANWLVGHINKQMVKDFKWSVYEIPAIKLIYTEKEFYKLIDKTIMEFKDTKKGIINIHTCIPKKLTVEELTVETMGKYNIKKEGFSCKILKDKKELLYQLDNCIIQILKSEISIPVV